MHKQDVLYKEKLVVGWKHCGAEGNSQAHISFII